MELSEEEKQAIKRIKFLIKEIKCQCDICKLNVVTFKIILNLINKQQKEIEELKSIASEFTNRNIEQFSIGEFNFKVKHFKDNYIHKDKIKEKIEEFQDVKKEIIKNENKLSRASITYDIVRNDYCEKMLQELLEENK